jgi:hypothetical protein
MKSIVAVSCASLLALTVLSSCGGSSSDSSASCSNTAACGGDITGKWTVVSSCVSPTGMTMVDPQCPTATSSGSTIKATGSVSYNADLTYSSMFTLSGSTSVTLPASCLTSQGITVTCAQLTQAFTMLTQTSNAPFKSASCANAGSGCTCTIVLSDQTSTASGTYTTSAAGVLTETPTGGTASESDYCVKGNTLTDSPHQSVDMGTMGQMAVSGTIVLSK